MKTYNILIISLYYLPKPSIASNRIYSFAKYLDKNKFNIFVYTIDEGVEYKNPLENVTIIRAKNKTFLKRATFTKRTNPLLHYLKVLYNKLLNTISPLEYGGWLKEGKKSVKKIIKSSDIDLVISSFSPLESHLLALFLKKEFLDLKWIADFRDQMSYNPFIDPKTRAIYTKYQKEILFFADAVTSVSKPILDEFKADAKQLDKKLVFKEIRNGYDFEIDKKRSNSKVFTITYTGNFYGGRNPETFLKALSLVADAMGEFRVYFVGVKTHFDIPKNLKDKIVIIPQLSHKEAIEYIKGADLLLLIHPKTKAKGIFTGKLFEYMASLNPILALVDKDDVAAKLIKKASCGYVAEFDDISEIKKMIKRAYEDFKNKTPFTPDINLIKKHHRKEQAKRLQKLIEELLG